MKTIVLAAIGCLVSWAGAHAQQANNCMSQYAEAPAGTTPASLISAGHDIKAGWAGGLWLQKGKDVYFCNSGIVREDATLCWKLREPVKNQPCQ